MQFYELLLVEHSSCYYRIILFTCRFQHVYCLIFKKRKNEFVQSNCIILNIVEYSEMSGAAGQVRVKKLCHLMLVKPLSHKNKKNRISILS